MKLMVREFRKRANMTQAALAADLNISRNTVWNWENGAAMPDAEQLWNLAVALGCTPNDLLGWADDVPEVAANYRQLNRANRSMVDAMAHSLLVTQQVEEIAASRAARRSA